MKIFDGKNGKNCCRIQFITEGLHLNTKLERINELSDGYHTYDELYEFREKCIMLYYLMNGLLIIIEVLKDYEDMDVKTLHPEIQNFLNIIKPKYNVHKSWRNYHDGELLF